MIPVAFISMYNPALAWKVVSSNQYLGQFLSDEPQPKSKIAFVAKFEYGNLEYAKVIPRSNAHGLEQQLNFLPPLVPSLPISFNFAALSILKK